MVGLEERGGVGDGHRGDQAGVDAGLVGVDRQLLERRRGAGEGEVHLAAAVAHRRRRRAVAAAGVVVGVAARGQHGGADDRGAAELEEAAATRGRHPEEGGLLVGRHPRAAADDLAEGVVPPGHGGLVVGVDRLQLSAQLVTVEIRRAFMSCVVPLVSGCVGVSRRRPGRGPWSGRCRRRARSDSKAPVGNSSSGPPSRARVSTVACWASIGRIVDVAAAKVGVAEQRERGGVGVGRLVLEVAGEAQDLAGELRRWARPRRRLRGSG